MSQNIYLDVLEEIYNYVVHHFNLLQSFNNTPYLFKKTASYQRSILSENEPCAQPG
jgi:hypothetical protein